MADSTAKLNILVQLRDEASTALSSMGNSISDLGGNLNFAGDMAGTLASAMAAIGAGAIIGNAIGEFAQAQVQMARFDAIIKTLPPSLQALRGEILKTADEAMNKFGFDNETAAMSLVRLVQATNDAPFAFQAFQAAMDLARYKGIGLEEASQALIIAFLGNARMLKTLGIEVDDHASKATILAAVMAKVKGQADEYTKTLDYQTQTMKLYGEEVNKSIGSIFEPLVNETIGTLIEWIKQQGGINAVIDKFSFAIKAAAIILSTMFVAGTIVAVAAALALLGPFGLIVAAIMAIIAIVILFYTAWKLYWNDVKDFFVGIWNGIVDWISNKMLAMWNIVSSTIDRIKGAINSIKGAYDSVVSAISQPIKSAVSSIGNFVGSITPFASGGIVTSPTLGLVGESGPEAIIPLSRLGSAGGGINIYLQGDFYTDTEVAEKFANKLATLIKYQLKM